MEIDTLPSTPKPSKTKKVLVGCFLVVLGIVLCYFFIYQKIQEMKLQQDITYSVKGMLLVPVCIVFGLYYILFTPSGSGALKDLSAKEKPYFWGAMAVFLLASAGLFYWFSLQLKAYGYQGLL